jgi:hypothetical protein
MPQSTHMKAFLRAAAITFAVVISSPAVLAQTYTTITNWSSGVSQTNQFNTNSGYERTFSIEGQPFYPAGAWGTTDAFDTNSGLGSTSLVAFINNWTPRLSNSGNNSVYFGGYNADSGTLPGTTNPSIYYSFNSIAALPGDVVVYTVDFGIIGPSSTLSGLYTNQDFFGISLRDAAGASMAGFTFNPFNSALTNGLRVEWEQNGTNVVADGVTFRNFDIQYNGLYRLTAAVQGSSLDLSIAGLNTQSAVGEGITNYSVITNQSIITGGSLSSGFTAADFERASIDWELSSGDNLAPGANYMILTAASVVSTLEVIPEPGTWLAGTLLVLMAGGLMVRRRRKLAT